MKNLWGNLIASVDVETTGVVANYNEIVQIAVVPLDKTLKPMSCSFYTNIRPEHPERCDPQSLLISGLVLEELMDAPSKERAIDLFSEWFETLPLPPERRLIPMAHNWTFEFGFLTAWLGHRQRERFFHHHPRDAMILALAIKDQYALRGLEPPFESVSLTNLCKVYGIVNTKPHDALADAIAEAELYRKLLGG